MSDHRRLDVWILARRLSRRVHGVVRSLPRDERFARSSQMIRSSNSVRNNIAEGASGTDAEFATFLRWSLRSVNEIHDQLDDLNEVGLLSEADSDLLDAYLELGRMIAGLHKSVMRRAQSSNKQRRP